MKRGHFGRDPLAGVEGSSRDRIAAFSDPRGAMGGLSEHATRLSIVGKRQESARIPHAIRNRLKRTEQITKILETGRPNSLPVGRGKRLNLPYWSRRGDFSPLRRSGHLAERPVGRLGDARLKTRLSFSSSREAC